MKTYTGVQRKFNNFKLKDHPFIAGDILYINDKNSTQYIGLVTAKNDNSFLAVPYKSACNTEKKYLDEVNKLPITCDQVGWGDLRESYLFVTKTMAPNAYLNKL